MDAYSIQLNLVHVRLSTRIRLTWRFWRTGYMPLKQAIRTFLVK